MLSKNSVLLFKTEVTYKTDPVPTAATDALVVQDLSIKPANERMVKRSGIDSTHGPLQTLYGGSLMQVEFNHELKGSGTAGTAPKIGRLLQACGMAETVVPATSVTYDPASSGQKSATIYVYRDGKLYKLLGCRGTWKMANAAGNPGVVTFTFTGHLALTGGVTDVALPSPTVEATVPPVMKSVALTVGGFSATVSKVDIDYGNVMSIRDDMNSENGYAEILLSDREPTCTLDPEDKLIATKDWFQDWRGGNLLALNLGPVGAAGNRVTITAPKLVFTAIAEGDREGVVTMDITAQLKKDSGDDELSIAFT
ncbi:MAG: phage tail tube protein [Nitrospinota bacterium]|nr:phage tail tube protein [Nitrospinota bacterium]